MSPINPSAIVDAVIADLTANSGLAPNLTIAYAEPTMPAPSDCPVLAVWSEDADYALLAGNPPTYERSHIVNVAWYVADPGAAETGGTMDPATVKALDGNIETLLSRLTTYTDGVPGLDGAQQVATLRSRHLQPQSGAMWRGLIEITVEEAA
jgi:hypothetical protein